MQKLPNTQLPQTQNEEKNLDDQELIDSKNPALDDIKAYWKWLFSVNTIWNTILLVFCVQGCNQIVDWFKSDNPVITQEEIQKEVSRTLELEEIQKEVLRNLKLEKKKKRTSN